MCLNSLNCLRIHQERTNFQEDVEFISLFSSIFLVLTALQRTEGCLFSDVTVLFIKILSDRQTTSADKRCFFSYSYRNVLQSFKQNTVTPRLNKLISY